MVRGLDIFCRHFEGHTDQFILIGGTAATLAMESAGLEFRATKDLDIVLHIDNVVGPSAPGRARQLFARSASATLVNRNGTARELGDAIAFPVPMPALVKARSLSRNDGGILVRLALIRTDSFPLRTPTPRRGTAVPYNKMPQTLRHRSRITTPCVFNSTTLRHLR